jgi:hypothetical protein
MTIEAYQAKKASEERHKNKERREKIATAICSGCVAGYMANNETRLANFELAANAIKIADELIRQLDEE